MPYPFALPTTSATPLTDFFHSSSHPSLVLTATSHRAVVRDALKRHKRLPPASQASNLSAVLDALTTYLPYLLAIHSALFDHSSSFGSAPTWIQVDQIRPLEIEWRTTLSSSPIPGREPARTKVKGLQNELAFVLQTMAYTHTLLSRTELLRLHTTSSLTLEQRASIATAAMRYLLSAQSLHAYVSTLPPSVEGAIPVDISQATSAGLAALALAEATLVVVTKDDPYTAAVAEDRDKNSKEWMIAAPTIPKVRAHLFARLCIAAGDHAAKAGGLLARSSSGGAFGSGSGAAGLIGVFAGGKLDESLTKYVDDLRRTAKGKAARFLGIDAEIAGKTGEAIAWLRGAKKELAILAAESTGEEGKRKGLKGLKQSWAERKEDKKLEKGGLADWGLEAGRLEEARVVEWLEAKWVKSNDMINVQTIPPSEPLLASMPSGREYHTPKSYKPDPLDSATLASMSAPPDPSRPAFTGNEEDSGDEVSNFRPQVSNTPGTFPGSSAEHSSGDYY